MCQIPLTPGRIQHWRGWSRKDLAEVTAAMAAGGRGVRVRAVVRYRVRRSWAGGREVLLSGKRHPEHHNHLRGVCELSWHHHLWLLRAGSSGGPFVGPCLDLKKVLLVLCSD